MGSLAAALLFVMYTGAVMKHTRYIKAELACNDADTYQWGQIRKYTHNGVQVTDRLVGYTKATRYAGSAAIWMELGRWSRRYQVAPKIMRKIKRNVIVRPLRGPVDTSIKTKGKRYRHSAAPMSFPKQIPTEGIYCVTR